MTAAGRNKRRGARLDTDMRLRLPLLILTLLAALVPAGAATAQSSKPPAVATGKVVDLTPTGATVTGSVNPRGRETTGFVEYGTGGKLDQRTPTAALGAADKAAPVRFGLSGLKPVAKYSYRVVARSSAGRTNGSTREFTTPPIPASVTLSSAPATVPFGDTAFLSGTVGGTGAGGSDVQPQFTEFPFSAGFANAGNALVANPDGTFGLVVQPRVTTQYRAVAKVDGKQAFSPVVTVGVAPKVGLSIRRGSKASFSGTVSPGGDAIVRLVRLTTTGRRTTVAKTITRGADLTTYRFPRRTIRSTRNYVVTVTPATGAFVVGESRIRQVRRTRRGR